MIRKAKKKKSKMRILLSFLLMAAIVVLTCKYIITPVAQHLFEQYVYDGTTPVPPSKIELDPSVSISSDKLNSPMRF